MCIFRRKRMATKGVSDAYRFPSFSSRLSVSGDDRKSGRVRSGIRDERDPAGILSLSLSQTPLIARALFRSSPLTESLEQAVQNGHDENSVISRIGAFCCCSFLKSLVNTKSPYQIIPTCSKSLVCYQAY